MNEKKEDLRILKSKAIIKNTLYQMVLKNEYNNITVLGLSTKARISRKTFYLHYRSLADVFDEIRNELLLELEDLIAKEAYQDDKIYIKGIFYAFNKAIENHKDFYKRIVMLNSYAFFLNDIIESFKKIIEKQIKRIHIKHPLESMYIEFFSAGIIWMYIKWLKGDYTGSLDHLTSFIDDAVNNGIKNLMRKL